MHLDLEEKRLKNTVQNCFCTPLTSSRDSDDEYNHDKGDDYDDCDDDDHDNYDNKSFMHETLAMKVSCVIQGGPKRGPRGPKEPQEANSKE